MIRTNHTKCGVLLAFGHHAAPFQALVAAKSYYFGVGGSVAAFRQLVEADGRFECAVARTFDDGASNRREVLANESEALAM